MGSAAPRRIPAAQLKNRDYYLCFLGESRFYGESQFDAGRYGKAHATFASLSKRRASRFAMPPWQAADCLWMGNRHGEAAAVYRKPLPHPGDVDPVVAHFRVAEVESETARRNGPDSRVAADRAFMQIHVEYPAHPLGIQAGERARELMPPVGRGTAAPGTITG
jgi:hypothetical protein